MSELDVRFIWIGLSAEDAYADRCYADVAQHNLGDIFKFLPSRRGVDPEISASDIFALPSREDPFPLVNVSALALGVPVVAFDGAGGAPEVLLPGAGLVVPNEDADAFAEAIIQLAKDPRLRSEMGKVGQQRYWSELRVEKAVSRIIELARCASPSALA
jgi:glycosyltransferase involved in cell wall biosynthesis